MNLLKHLLLYLKTLRVKKAARALSEHARRSRRDLQRAKLNELRRELGWEPVR